MSSSLFSLLIFSEETQTRKASECEAVPCGVLSMDLLCGSMIKDPSALAL